MIYQRRNCDYCLEEKTLKLLVVFLSMFRILNLL